MSSRIPIDLQNPTPARDLSRIRESGSWLLRTEGARKAFDKQLGELNAKPQVEWKDDDANLRSRQVAVNKISIRGTARGFPYCPPGAVCAMGPSTVSMKVGDETYNVFPQTGESSSSILRRLANQLKTAGYETKISHYAGAAQLAVISKSGSGAQGDLNVADVSTDGRVQMNVRPRRRMSPDAQRRSRYAPAARVRRDQRWR